MTQREGKRQVVKLFSPYLGVSDSCFFQKALIFSEKTRVDPNLPLVSTLKRNFKSTFSGKHLGYSALSPLTLLEPLRSLSSPCQSLRHVDIPRLPRASPRRVVHRTFDSRTGGGAQLAPKRASRIPEGNGGSQRIRVEGYQFGVAHSSTAGESSAEDPQQVTLDPPGPTGTRRTTCRTPPLPRQAVA
jgi:hypothetical protein